MSTRSKKTLTALTLAISDDSYARRMPSARR